MPFSPEEWFEFVEKGESKRVIALISSYEENDTATRERDVNQVDSITRLPAFAIAIRKAVAHVDDKSSMNNYILIITSLLLVGVNPDTPYKFNSTSEKMSAFRFACLNGNLGLVEVLYDYISLTEEEKQRILGGLATSGKEDIMNFLKNPEEYSLKKHKTYEKMSSTMSSELVSLVETGQHILRDYFAPEKFSFLHFPFLQLLLTFHLKRHADNFLMAENHVKHIKQKQDELGIDPKNNKRMLPPHREKSQKEKEALLLEEYKKRLTELNQYIAESNTINHNGSFVRRVRFLNKKLIDFIKIQQERQGADHAFSSPISTTEPRPIDILSAAPGMTAAEDLEIRSLESDLEPGESWHDPCDPALAEPRSVSTSPMAPAIAMEEIMHPTLEQTSQQISRPPTTGPRPIDKSRVVPGITVGKFFKAQAIARDLKPGFNAHDFVDSAFLNRPQ